jgi:phospholipid-binding lipoprotein MlaA
MSNLSNLITVPNNLLQGDIKQAGVNTARFVINTTVGILGIFDPAEVLGFKKEDKEDYGQTLGSWGVGPGCYVVLPILGPSTVRDTVGTVATFVGGDPWYNVTTRNDTNFFKESDYYGTRITGGIDFRAKNIDSLESIEKNSIDFYASIRSLYLQDRQQKILNSKKVTDTMNDSDWEEIESK